MFIQPNAAKFVQYRILKIRMRSRFHLTAPSLLACLPTRTDLQPIPLCSYIAFKLSENKCNFHRHEFLLFRLQYSMCTITCPLFIHSNRLILPKIKVLTLNHGINIPYKVLKLYSKQLR